MNQSEPEQAPLPLGTAIKRFWPNLIGLALFPMITFWAESLPALLVKVLFFTVFAIATWPVFTKKAPKAFWFVALAIWIVAIQVGLYLSWLIEFVSLGILGS